MYLVLFYWFWHSETPIQAPSLTRGFSRLDFSRKFLYSSVLLHYIILVCWSLYLFASSAIKNKIPTEAFWSWTPTIVVLNLVRVFAMIEEKIMVSGVKVELNPFDGWTQLHSMAVEDEEYSYSTRSPRAYWASSTSSRWPRRLETKRISRRWPPSSYSFPMKSYIMSWKRWPQKVCVKNLRSCTWERHFWISYS